MLYQSHMSESRAKKIARAGENFIFVRSASNFLLGILPNDHLRPRAEEITPRCDRDDAARIRARQSSIYNGGRFRTQRII